MSSQDKKPLPVGDTHHARGERKTNAEPGGERLTLRVPAEEAFGKAPPEVWPDDDPFYQSRAERLATFHKHIEDMWRDGVYQKEHGFIEEFVRGGPEEFAERKPNIPWKDCPEGRKLEEIVDGALSWYIAGTYALAVIEEVVKYDKLAPWQRDMLAKVRLKIDAGELDSENPDQRLDSAWHALHDIVAIDNFDQELAYFKREGIYDPFPNRRPWDSLQESEKAAALARMSYYFHPPGAYALAAIDREVDAGKLPEWWRRELNDLRAGIDQGRPQGRESRGLSDRLGRH
jgi:hypothetical protein